MKKISITVFIFVITLFLAVKSTDAHVLKTDRDIGAILHIDPDDDPIAGQQSSFFFEFKDIQNKFSPPNCDCIFSIIENGNEIYSQPLFQNNSNPSLTNASVFYTFPQKDVYQVKVVGKPNTPDAFQPFTLTYDVRVARVADQSAPSQQRSFFSEHLSYPVIGGVVITLFLIFIIANYIHNKKTMTKGGDKPNDKEINNIQY